MSDCPPGCSVNLNMPVAIITIKDKEGTYCDRIGIHTKVKQGCHGQGKVGQKKNRLLVIYF